MFLSPTIVVQSFRIYGGKLVKEKNMNKKSATAISNPNIALIKYWGNLDNRLRLPANGSISMNLDGLLTRTTVTWLDQQKEDTSYINGKRLEGKSERRIVDFLDIVRGMAGIDLHAEVFSENNFPSDAGIASSASAFAALALAASEAAGLDLDETQLSRLARKGSGSACRSIPEGFVEWQAGEDDIDSYAASIAPADHWDLIDCIVIVDAEPKKVSSTDGHALATTSPLQKARIEDTPRRLETCRKAIQKRDFNLLTEIVELDSNMMHAVMQSSSPPLLYWQPATIMVMHQVRIWRKDGLPVCYTLDAGPNVHVICTSSVAEYIQTKIRDLPGVLDVILAGVGKAARLI